MVLLLLSLVLFLPYIARAQTSRMAQPNLNASFGFGNLYRPNEYAPVYLTAPAIPDPQTATVEVHAYLDSRLSVVTRTPIVLQSRPTIWCVPAILGTWEDSTSVILRDKSGQIIASERPSVSAVPLAPANRLVIVASGAGAGGDIELSDTVSASLPIARVPVRPELLASVDTVVLTNTTLDDLSAEQANAIAAWVCAGGRLLVCVGPEGLSSSTLADLLPVRVGSIQNFTLAGTTLTGRQLTPVQDAVLLASSPASLPIYAIPRGLGQVLATGLPLSRATSPLLGLALRQPGNRIQLDFPQIPSAPSSALPLSRAQFATLLLVVGLLLGPVEAVRRRHFNAWPWRWHVLAGLALLLAGAALHYVPNGEPPIVERIALVDQTPAFTVAITTLEDAGHLYNKEPAGFQIPLRPLRVPGTEHGLITLASEPAAVTVTTAPPQTAILTSIIERYPPTVEVTSFDLAARTAQLRSSTPLQTVLLETADGIYSGQLDPASGVYRFTTPVGDPPHATLPIAFAQARRLTPLRSAQLQARVASRTHVSLWTRDGNNLFTRTSLPALPPAPTSQPQTSPREAQSH
jgi:hypothetical protein